MPAYWVGTTDARYNTPLGMPRPAFCTTPTPTPTPPHRVALHSRPRLATKGTRAAISGGTDGRTTGRPHARLPRAVRGAVGSRSSPLRTPRRCAYARAGAQAGCLLQAPRPRGGRLRGTATVWWAPVAGTWQGPTVGCASSCRPGADGRARTRCRAAQARRGCRCAVRDAFLSFLPEPGGTRRAWGRPPRAGRGGIAGPGASLWGRGPVVHIFAVLNRTRDAGARRDDPVVWFRR